MGFEPHSARSSARDSQVSGTQFPIQAPVSIQRMFGPVKLKRSFSMTKRMSSQFRNGKRRAGRKTATTKANPPAAISRARASRSGTERLEGAHGGAAKAVGDLPGRLAGGPRPAPLPPPPPP